MHHYLIQSESWLDFILIVKTPQNQIKVFIYPDVIVSFVCLPRWTKGGSNLQLAQYYFFLTFLVQARISNTCIITSDCSFPLVP